MGIVVVVVWFLTKESNDIPAGVEVASVSRGDVVEVVSETGIVASEQEVAVAFERGGRVAEIPVTVGMTVQKGDVLIKLDAREQEANLNAAKARLEAEQVRLAELQNGADDASLAVSESSIEALETALKNAERTLAEVDAQYDQSVANAEKTLRSSGLEGYLLSDVNENQDNSYAAPIITGTYVHPNEGSYQLELFASGAPSGSSFRFSGLENGLQTVSTASPVPLGTRGLYIQFPENFVPRTKWEVQIPNTRSSSYLTNLNAYRSAVDARNVAVTNAENAVRAAEAALAQGESQHVQTAGSARVERIVAQRALVRQMEASAQAAQVAYDNMTIRAPFDGAVTTVMAEVGEIIAPSTPVLSLISQNNFKILVNIPESDIGEVDIDDKATVVLDAYRNLTFNAHVVSIAPNATPQDGVRVFAIELLFDEPSEYIRSGLSADIELLTETRSDVIAVPSRAVVENEDGRFVRALTDGRLSYIPITAGLRGSNGLTEITEGLNDGQNIITFIDADALKLLEAQ